ncbi:hypothetical protein ODJ79_09840 [Actinoplanes sp. KI2]|nr:hypothetical protein [Actinoplanes sp. KI2]MCU7724015.1 hypothetical protein [Actinoplanes sp. KI2]
MRAARWLWICRKVRARRSFVGDGVVLLYLPGAATPRGRRALNRIPR